MQHRDWSSDVCSSDLNKTRNPKVKGVNEFVNNVVYNYGNANTTYEHTISADAYIIGGESEGESNVTILNNYVMGGPSPPASESTTFSRGTGNFTSGRGHCREIVCQSVLSRGVD